MRLLAALAAGAVALGGLVACSGDEPLADVCKVADLEFITLWTSGEYELVASQANDCSYRSDEFGAVVHITAARSGGVPTVRVRVKSDDSPREIDDELLAAYLAEAAYGVDRAGPIAERVAALQRLPSTHYPCSIQFVATNGTAMVSTWVDDRGGDPMVGSLRVEFGEALPSTVCSDVEEENTTAIVEERWPASYEEIRMELPPGDECGSANVHLVGVQAFPPDGSVVELGDITMTNTNWMVEPPFECRRT